MVLNQADDIKIGTTQVDKVYLGSTLVWQKKQPIPIYEAVHSPSDEVWYTTEEGEALVYYSWDMERMGIISNTYIDGKGIIKFNHTLTEIPQLLLAIQPKTITSFYYPNTVEIITEQTFATLEDIKKINCDTDGVIIVGENVKVIEEDGFDMGVNQNIKTLILGSNIETIGYHGISCFYVVSDSNSIYCYAKIQPNIYYDSELKVYFILDGSPKGTFHYPSGSDYSLWTSNEPYCLGNRSLGWTCLADL